MSEKPIFVGRKEELEQFKKVLQDPQGQAILVVGQAGMGKTFLLNKMAEIAAKHLNLKCGCVRYEVISNDSVDMILGRMMDDAFHAGDVVEGSFDNTALRRKQWYALLETMVPRGEKISRLIQSLERNQQRPTREEFLDRMRLISGKIKANGRAVFIIDPLEYLEEEKDEYAEDWAIIVRDLPDKIKLVFAQRPEDVLVRYRKFSKLENVKKIPHYELNKLDETAVDELIDLRAGETNYTVSELRKSLGRYKGHPYALQGALNLIATGTKIEELPDDPTERGIIEEQWNKICKCGENAICLFKAYAILEEIIPDDVIEGVTKIETNTRLTLLADNVFLARLLYGEGNSKRIYHLLLAEYILGQMNDDEKKQYHLKAMEIYRGKLKKAEKEKTKPDELAATRLPEHVWAIGGDEAFVEVFINECGKFLLTLGTLDTFIALSERALKMVKKGSEEQAVLLGNLGLIYRRRGELDGAEKMHKKALAIDEKLGRLEEMASDYNNLGLIYQTRGELDEAEKMYKKALAIHERLGLQEGMANQYGNLGLIYRMRGDLDKAEEMHKKSLHIEEKLGRLEGMASDYAALGLVYYDRQNLGKAEEMHIKGLEIEKRLGRLEGLARQYGNLGIIYQSRGDLDEAEKMYKEALAIDEKLGRLEGMAIQYCNLGIVYKIRGELDKAKEYWTKSRDLYKKIGAKHMVKKVQGWIDSARPN